MRVVWLFCGFLSLGTAFIGIVLPLVPTVPLILLAAFCFARSSERLHAWLIEHGTFGPMITDWAERGAIRPWAKRLATASIIVVFLISVVLSAPMHVLAIQVVVLGAVLIFIWTRPNA